MTEQDQAHATSLLVIQAPEMQTDAGAEMKLKVKVVCSSGCDLKGSRLSIVDERNETIKEVELLSRRDTVDETTPLVVQAPVPPGKYTWTAVLPAQEKDGLLHKASATPFSFVVKPHATSLAIWDDPSPVVLNSRFKLKVGVKCSTGCTLAHQLIEIYDHTAARVSVGELGEAPWSLPGALYWTELELPAPTEEGLYRWTAKFPPTHLEFAHEEASQTFSFGVAKPPEHTVTVEVVDKDSGAPLKFAIVTLHSTGTPYRERTDETGMARLNVPKGEYEVHVLATDYKWFQTTAAVAGDLAIQVQLVYVPPRQD